MAAMLTEPESGREDSAESDRAASLPDGSALEDRMPVWFRTTKRSTICVLILATLFCFFSHRRLWHTDLWGHLAYGRVIWESQAIPETEPLMPLADGMPLVDTAWLSQVIGYAAYQQFGVTILTFLYAAAILVGLSLLLWRIVRVTGDLTAGVTGLGAFLWMEWQALGVIRPQLAGLCCCLVLLVLLTSRKRRRHEWIAVAVLMVLWANLHGSFPMGLLLIGTFFVGRAGDLFRRTGKIRVVWRDAKCRRLFVLLEIAAVAVLVNPYGPQLYSEVFRVMSNPNMADLTEWSPLTLQMKQGQAAFSVAIALIILLRFTPRRITTTESLLLIGLGAASLWASRFLVWWAPVAAMSLAVHGHAVLRRRFRQRKKTHPESDARRSLWTVASIGLCWIAFAYTPFGFRVVHGIEPELDDIVSAETPVRAADFLKNNPPNGQIFNPYEWGDYLAWNGPQPPNVFVTSHAHIVPRKVWEHYILILTAASGWEELLARYGAQTVVINRYQTDQSALLRRLRGSPNWGVVFRDKRSVIFERNRH